MTEQESTSATAHVRGTVSRTISRLGIALLLTCLPLSALAADRLVPSPYSTIQAAIDASVDGDRIIVSTGTYTENLSIGGKNIILQSTDPANSSVVTNTVIDGGGTGTVVTFTGTESAACQLSGFTITNGSAGTDGGGILGNGTLATIRNNRITGNQVLFPVYAGGGLSGCHGLIEDNLISGNTSNSYGGGLDSCSGTIRGNLITGNSAQYGGGLGYCNGVIEDCVVTGNTAENGGGFGFCTATVIRNCTITLNTATDEGGGMFACQGLVEYNTFTENSAATYGGAIEAVSGTLQHNYFANNTANYGGALGGITGLIANNVIVDNTATWVGGALAWGSGTMVNNLIARNTAWEGGAVGFYGNDIRNNLFYDNVASEYGGALDSCFGTLENNVFYNNSAGNSGGGLFQCDSSTTIQNNVFWANAAVSGAQLYNSATPSYSCIQGWVGGGTDNLTLDPLFANAPGEDFRLQDGSPCIDAGNPDPAYQDECTPPGKGTRRNDMGAYGGVRGCAWVAGTQIGVPGDHPTIQAAIAAANDGDEIVVAAQTYTENIFFMGKNITLRSTDPTDPAVVANTIIQPPLFGPVVTFSGTETASCTLSGFTLTGGEGFNYGGGISGNMTLATIQYNVITGNTASYGGGIGWCHGTIRHNTITQNTSSAYGGGLGFCDGLIENNRIGGNVADAFGGGLAFCDGTIRSNAVYLNSATSVGGGLAYCGYNQIGLIENNLVYENSAEGGGGLANCASALRNNTIYGNSATLSGGGIGGCPDVVNCILWANTAPVDAQVALPLIGMVTPPLYSCIQDWPDSLTHNISENPRLVDPAAEDFHLRSNSPCVDAGAAVSGLTTDYEGNPRPLDGTSEARGDGSDFDIGAYECTTGQLTGLDDWQDYR